MSDTLIRSKPAARSYHLVLAALVVAAALAVILAVGAWASFGNSEPAPKSSPQTTDWVCGRTGPC